MLFQFNVHVFLIIIKNNNIIFLVSFQYHVHDV